MTLLFAFVFFICCFAVISVNFSVLSPLFHGLALITRTTLSRAHTSASLDG